jgi:hypothetical protein
MMPYPRLGRKRISAEQIAERLEQDKALWIRIGAWKEDEQEKARADLIRHQLPRLTPASRMSLAFGISTWSLTRKLRRHQQTAKGRERGMWPGRAMLVQGGFP